MIIGYARVSTLEQNIEAQIEALRSAGCEKIFSEKLSGKPRKRPELDKLFGQLRSDDVLVVTKLDRLARSISDLVAIMADLREKGVGFKSLGEGMDLSSPQGRLQMNLFASIAEFERELIVERTKEGLAHARAQGRVGGRRPALNDLQRKEVIARVERGDLTIPDVARLFKVSPATVHRVMRQHRDQQAAA